MKRILSYQQIDIKLKNVAGNKAYNLGILARNSIRVPQFTVLGNEVFNEIINSAIIKLIYKKILNISLADFDKDGNEISKILNQINMHIGHYDLSKTLETEIIESISQFKTDHFAIRSSATGEDGASSSFAGQFLSLLNIDKNEVFTSIKKIWQSVFTEQVIIYCLYHEIDFNQIKMAVMLQEMIMAEKGGVIFTQGTNNKNHVVIEAALGLGENVVAGLTDSQRLVFCKLTNKCIEGGIGFKKWILSLDEAKKLFVIAKQIEKIFGQPQDIEWAINRGKVYILQARPITK